jgi:hypothetical protein
MSIDRLQEVILGYGDRQAPGKGHLWGKPLGRTQAELGTRTKPVMLVTAARVFASGIRNTP